MANPEPHFSARIKKKHRILSYFRMFLPEAKKVF